jgi:hypothetical protein
MHLQPRPAGKCRKRVLATFVGKRRRTWAEVYSYNTQGANVRSICALFIGLRLLFMVLGVIR